jgi:hypothetical protein
VQYFAKLLTPNPSDYHSEIRRIPSFETCLVPRVSDKRFCTCISTNHSYASYSKQQSIKHSEEQDSIIWPFVHESNMLAGDLYRITLLASPKCATNVGFVKTQLKIARLIKTTDVYLKNASIFSTVNRFREISTHTAYNNLSYDS